MLNHVCRLVYVAAACTVSAACKAIPACKFLTRLPRPQCPALPSAHDAGCAAVHMASAPGRAHSTRRRVPTRDGRQQRCLWCATSGLCDWTLQWDSKALSEVYRSFCSVHATPWFTACQQAGLRCPDEVCCGGRSLCVELGRGQQQRCQPAVGTGTPTLCDVDDLCGTSIADLCARLMKVRTCVLSL